MDPFRAAEQKQLTTKDTKVHKGPTGLVSVGSVARNVRANKVRHRRPTAHARARYRCFLPDLAGLARVRRAGPMPDEDDFNILR